MPNFIQGVQICNISHPNKLVFMFKDTLRTISIYCALYKDWYS